MSSVPGNSNRSFVLRNKKTKNPELKENEMEQVNGGKMRYKEIEKYLTEEQKKELEEFEKRVANS